MFLQLHSFLGGPIFDDRIQEDVKESISMLGNEVSHVWGCTWGNFVPPHNTHRGLTETVVLVFQMIFLARKICGDFNFTIEENS